MHPTFNYLINIPIRTIVLFNFPSPILAVAKAMEIRMTDRTNRDAAAQLAFIALVIMSSLTRPADAQQPTTTQRDAIRTACRSDYEAHCTSVPTGGKPALMCLQKNMASLSQPCQNAVGAIGKPSATAPPTPSPQTPAATVPGTASTPALTTPASGSSTQPSQTQIDTIRQACRTDYQAACAGVPPGGAAALSCLQKNVATLSQPCEQAVNAAGSAQPSANTTATTSDPKSTTTGAAMAPNPGALTPRQEIFLVRSSCRQDFRMQCGGVPLGGGRVVECLRANKMSLSPRCQGALVQLGQLR